MRRLKRHWPQAAGSTITGRIVRVGTSSGLLDAILALVVIRRDINRNKTSWLKNIANCPARRALRPGPARRPRRASAGIMQPKLRAGLLGLLSVATAKKEGPRGALVKSERLPRDSGRLLSNLSASPYAPSSVIESPLLDSAGWSRMGVPSFGRCGSGPVRVQFEMQFRFGLQGGTNGARTPKHLRSR